MAASRRFLAALGRRSPALFHRSMLLDGLSSAHRPSFVFSLPDSRLHLANRFFSCTHQSFSGSLRHFSSHGTPSSGGDEDDDEKLDGDEDDDDEDESGCEMSEEGEDEGEVSGPKRSVFCGKSEQEKATEAEEVGYKVLGPLDPSEKPFKQWEPVFAVIQVGSHQFKVCNGDSIFTERLKYCEINDKLVLNKVLMLGSKTETIIGRPILPEAAVHAVVEEHALDAKVIIFKKKRRKNYRRTRGHRQELTKLRITDIQGIVKPTSTAIPA